MRRERRRAIDVRQIGGVMIGAGMYRALWRWIERAGGGGDLLLVMVWVGDSQKNIEWHYLVGCLSREGDFALFYVRRPEISHQNIATTIS
jgi:hypothetical protein